MTHVESGSIGVFYQDSDGFSSLESIAEVSNTHTVAAADITSNGALDIVSAEQISDGSSELLLLTQSEAGWGSTLIGTGFSEVVDIEITDINHDDLLDVVIDFASSAVSPFVQYQNDLGEIIWSQEASLVVADNNSVYDIYTYDINDDGYQDVLSVSNTVTADSPDSLLVHYVDFL